MSEGRRYRIINVLGKGGFGTVYRADLMGDGGFTKKVALKVLNPDMEGIEDVAHRLRDEARLLGILRHRAIVQVDGLVMLNDRWAVVMEYIDGIDLQRLVRDRGAIPLGCALEVISEVAGALDVAYMTIGPNGTQLCLLHRDIKPPNILLTSAGEIKVLDFGIARADFSGREAQTKSVLYGSIGYMAPERMEFEELPAGDVYALGTVLFELISGAPLGQSSINPKKHMLIVQQSLEQLWKKLPAAPHELRELLASMLAYDPHNRPTARDIERRCRVLRNQVGEPWLRDWAEKIVPSFVAPTDTHIDDLYGSTLVERSTHSMAQPIAVIPKPVVRPIRPSKSSSSLLVSLFWSCAIISGITVLTLALAGATGIVGMLAVVGLGEQPTYIATDTADVFDPEPWSFGFEAPPAVLLEPWKSLNLPLGRGSSITMSSKDAVVISEKESLETVDQRWVTWFQQQGYTETSLVSMSGGYSRNWEGNGWFYSCSVFEVQTLGVHVSISRVQKTW